MKKLLMIAAIAALTACSEGPVESYQTVTREGFSSADLLLLLGITAIK